MRKLKCIRSTLWISTFIFCLGLFFESSALLKGFIGNETLKIYSFLPYIGLFMIANTDVAGNRDFNYRKFDKAGLYLFYFLSVIFVLSVTYLKVWNIRGGYFISTILPAIIITYRFRSKNHFWCVFNLFMRFMFIACCLMLFTELLDIVTHLSASRFIAQFSGAPTLVRQVNVSGRCVTYLGHPLYSSEIFLSFYLLNHLLSIVKNERESIVPALIALIGIVLAQSKTCSVLLILCFLIFNFNKKGLRYIAVGLLFFAIAYALGFFDSLISRFMDGIESGDLTTGRNAALSGLINTGYLKFDFFKQQDLLNADPIFSVALEYPVLRWAYSFGIMIAILLVFLLLVYPLIIVFKNGNKDFIIAMGALILDVNTYSGLGDVGIRIMMYYIVCVLILNLSIYYKMELIKPNRSIVTNHIY